MSSKLTWTYRAGVTALLLGASALAFATEGEVKKVDKVQGKVTIKANAIKNLDMPAMTMVFRARPPSLLEGVAEGDSVSFEADKVDGQYIVTALKKR
jgi:Cu(I)/Ag(I) efflux system periplasmic protein CusF